MKLAIKSILICTLTWLLISRLLVLCHEIIGHGIPVLIEGGHVRGCILYFFGGGALVSTYKVSLMHSLFIVSGGWLSQLLLALVALTLLHYIKGNHALRFFLFLFAYLNVAHAFYYMATGIYYGYGDGTIFYRHLPILRPWLVVISSISMIISCYILSRKLSENFILRLASRKRHQILAMVGLVLIASGVHFTLYKVEYSYLPNQVTDTISTPEHLKLPPEKRTKPFPFSSILIAALFLSTLAGMLRHTHLATTPHTPSWRSIVAVFAVLSVTLTLFAYIRIPIDQIPIVTTQSKTGLEE